MRRLLAMQRVMILLAAGALQACGLFYSAEEIEAWVVDADTQAPIEGVNVVAHWKLKFGIEGGSSSDLELMESVTDANGRFYFPAWGPKSAPLRISFTARLQHADPEIIFFKAGYEPLVVYNDRDARPYGFFGGPRVRTSLWHGKKISLKRAVDQERYVAIAGGALTGVSWGRCGWTRIPRMIVALNAEAERLSSQGILHSMLTIRRVELTAKDQECEPVLQILKERQQ